MQAKPHKGNPWNTIVTLRSWRNGCRSKPTRSTYGTRLCKDKGSISKTFMKNCFKKIKLWSKFGQIWAWGYPPGGLKMELAAKTRQEASKSCFKEALEAPWRCLGGALGGPRESQVGAKSKLGGSPEGTASAWARHPLAWWENYMLVSKMQYFHGFLKVLQNRACVPAMKKSPKGDFLHNNHHDSVI